MSSGTARSAVERYLNLILMAAGSGKRYGSNKLLAVIEGKLLYRHAFERLLRYRQEHPDACQVIVVSAYDEILSAAEDAGLVAVKNELPQAGISRTIRLGIAAIEGRHPAEAAVFFTADQPFMRYETMENFLQLAKTSNAGLITAACAGNFGNPVSFDCKYFPELLGLQGDYGGKTVLRLHPEDVAQFDVAAAELMDIDFPTG